MEKATPIELYVFRKSNQQAIQLCLYKGVIPRDAVGTNRFRWMIKGTQNPFPVRNGTWFEGFTPAVMMSYLMVNGYELSEKVSLSTF